MGATQPLFCQWWQSLKLCVGERNNFHHCLAHHAILYFPLAILINYSANLNIYVEEQSLAKYTQNSSNVFWEMQGGATCHTTAEIRTFFNAQFQSCVISCKAKVKWLPYSPTQPPLILLILHHDLLAQRKAVNYQWTEKNLQGHGTHDSRADDPRPSGQYPQKMQCPQTSWRRPHWVLFCNTYQNCSEFSFTC